MLLAWQTRTWQEWHRFWGLLGASTRVTRPADKVRSGRAQPSLGGAPHCLAPVLAPAVALVLILLPALAFGWEGASSAKPTAPVGIMRAGSVRINGRMIPSGTAVFAGNNMSTSRDGSALVELLSGSSAPLAAGSDATLLGEVLGPLLRACNPPPGRSDLPRETRIELPRGVLTLWSAWPYPARVNIAQGAVILKREQGSPTLCTVAANQRHALLFPRRGRVEIHTRVTPVVLPPGESMRVEAGGPQGQSHRLAGEVVDSMPEELVLHAGQKVEEPLGLGELVSVDDSIRTLEEGRVRLRLFGNVYLNMGARSAVTITSHDPDNQFTRILLTRGQLRVEAARMTKPGASFEVRTPEAVASGAGATFVMAALRKETEACAIDGTITVRRMGSAAFVRVAENQCTRVPSGQDPLPPRESSKMLHGELLLRPWLEQPEGLVIQRTSAAVAPRATASGIAGMLAGLPPD